MTWFGIKLAQDHDNRISELFRTVIQRETTDLMWFSFKCVFYIYFGGFTFEKKIHTLPNSRLFCSWFIDLVNYRAPTAPNCLSGIMLCDKLLISEKLQRASICPPSFLMSSWVALVLSCEKPCSTCTTPGGLRSPGTPSTGKGQLYEKPHTWEWTGRGG